MNMQSRLTHRAIKPSGSRSGLRVRASAAQKSGARIVVKDFGEYSVKGTVRRVNEDRCSTLPSPSGGNLTAFSGVYDGHGGSAVAEWLAKNFPKIFMENFSTQKPTYSTTDAFLSADSTLLTAKSGFMGMGERGVGGSKCGATAAIAALYESPTGTKLLTANVGDARIVVVDSNGQHTTKTVDHVPDDVQERNRIERFNPNPKMPLVKYQGGTWRVGGLLALSRAFGDAYLKGSLQFEGLPAGSDGYSSGFGLIAEPYIENMDVDGDGDKWVVIASDGLFNEESRGGGGGLDANSLSELLMVAGDAPASKIAQTLASTAINMGSTDDVTVVLLRIGAA